MHVYVPQNQKYIDIDITKMYTFSLFVVLILFLPDLIESHFLNFIRYFNKTKQCKVTKYKNNLIIEMLEC